MPSLSLAQYSKEEIKEMSMIELAYDILAERTDRTAISFKEILDQIIDYLELTQDQVKATIAQFYTDLNIDGRFVSVGENRWGLRDWYPFDQVEDDTIQVAKPKKKKGKKAPVKDEFDEFEDAEELDEIEEEELDYDDDDDDEEELEVIDGDAFEGEDIVEDDDEEYDIEEEELDEEFDEEEEEDDSEEK